MARERIEHHENQSVTEHDPLHAALSEVFSGVLSTRIAHQRERASTLMSIMRKKARGQTPSVSELLEWHSTEGLNHAGLDDALSSTEPSEFDAVLAQVFESFLIQSVKANNPTLFKDVYALWRRVGGKPSEGLAEALEETPGFIISGELEALIEKKMIFERTARAADIVSEAIEDSDDLLTAMHHFLQRIKGGFGRAFEAIIHSRAIPIGVGVLAAGVAVYELYNGFTGSALSKASAVASFTDTIGSEVGYAMLAFHALSLVAGITLIASAVSGIVSSVLEGLEARRVYREAKAEHLADKEDPVKAKAFEIARAHRNAAYRKVGVDVAMGVVLLAAAAIIAFPAVILGSAAAAIGAVGLTIIGLASFVLTSIIGAFAKRKIDASTDKALARIDAKHPDAFELTPDSAGVQAKAQHAHGTDFRPHAHAAVGSHSRSGAPAGDEALGADDTPESRLSPR